MALITLIMFLFTSDEIMSPLSLFVLVYLPFIYLYIIFSFRQISVTT